MGNASRRAFRLFKEMCGTDTLKNVVIVTTMWEKVTPDQGEKREEELRTNQKFFKPALDKQARLARHDNTKHSARDILRTILKYQPLALSIQREVIDERMELHDTMAGKEFESQTEELIRTVNIEVEKLMEDLAAAHQTDIGALRQELDEYKEKLSLIHQELKKLRSPPVPVSVACVFPILPFWPPADVIMEISA
jgi:hypothetical protein